MSERKKSAHWTTAGDIAAAAEKLWSGGRLPSALISGEELFPYSIKLSCPKTSEMAENIAEVRAWRAALDARSANERRRSYRLEYRSVRHSVLGKNSIPCRAVIETAEDALSLYLRADFPHDAYWIEATVTLDDGHEQTFSLEGRDGAQRIALGKHRVRRLRLHRLIKCDDPSAFPALRQIEVFGRDIESGSTDEPIREE